ncbi:iron-siderophore ABC transporter substrate-binding protein [Klebsiella variicola]|uniref:iron-siderophore ABC transporter substrate-binding protein n=1 Tax=Klebsiella variicola TaxID=244366 RepID=UPI001D196DD6|nr:iron-siderophore ABC transporter substrate-binding protein [Klebsiella variicola]
MLTAALLAPALSWANSTPVPQRLAVLDWGLTEMILALGITPAGVSAPDWYRKLIPTPVLPPTVQDLGLLFQPNLETLYALKPDAIVITPQHVLLKPALAQVAPLLTLPAHGLSDFISATQQLGVALNRETQAAVLLTRLHQQIARARDHARSLRQPVIIAAPVDALHLRLYTVGSLPGDVLAACGMRNAWHDSGGAEGNVLVELTRIVGVDARLILLVAADQQDVVSHWQQSPLWRRLPLTSRYPIARIVQQISDAGALITAGRFADIFSLLMAGWRDA